MFVIRCEIQGVKLSQLWGVDFYLKYFGAVKSKFMLLFCFALASVNLCTPFTNGSEAMIKCFGVCPHNPYISILKKTNLDIFLKCNTVKLTLCR